MTKTNLQTTEIYLQKDIHRATVALEFLHTHREILERLDLKVSFFGNHIDFDNLERPALLAVLKAFPGNWTKTPSFVGTGLNYELKTPVNGLTIRCYNGEPPPSCHIEETVEWVLVPERLEKKVTRKVVCPEPLSSDLRG